MTSPFNARGQWAWDSVSLGAYMTCPTYYRYKLVEGWERPGKNVHLFFGQLYAAALERVYKAVFAGAAFKDALRDVVRWLLVETWEYGYRTPADVEAKRDPIPGTGQPWDSGHPTKTRETLIRTVVWYFEQFPIESDPCETIRLNDGTPAVELSFQLSLGDEFMWCGHLDRLVNYGDSTYVMDQKTTGSTITPRWFDQWQTESQFLGYTLAGKIIYNIPVSGVIVDAAQIAVGFSRFERGFVHFSEAQLEEWMDEALQFMRQANEAFQSGQWLHNRKSCNNYGGCPYRTICSRTPSLREQFLKAEFNRVKPWNPLESR